MSEETWCPVHGAGVPVDEHECAVMMYEDEACGCIATGPGADAACAALGRAEKAERERDEVLKELRNLLFALDREAKRGSGDVPSFPRHLEDAYERARALWFRHRTEIRGAK